MVPRNRPLRLRNRLIIGLALCALICIAANPFNGQPSPLRIILFSVGTTAILFGIPTLLFTQEEVVGYAHLQNPANQIATWSIPSQTWQAFQSVNEAWNKTPGLPRNLIDQKQQAPLTVIAGRRMILVGDDFYNIGNLCSRGVQSIGITEPHPQCVEVRCLMSSKSGVYLVALRFPINTANRLAAERLVQAWQEELPRASST